MPQYHPGDAVPSRCTRCNDVTGHVIVALVGSEIVKVECRACGSVHRYRPPERPSVERVEAPRRVRQGANRSEAMAVRKPVSAAKPARSTAPKRALQAALELERDWETSVATAPGASRLYAMQERFEVGDLIDHPTFGSGVVREMVPPDKMRILFRDGVRLLRCAC